MKKSGPEHVTGQSVAIRVSSNHGTTFPRRTSLSLRHASISSFTTTMVWIPARTLKTMYEGLHAKPGAISDATTSTCVHLIRILRPPAAPVVRERLITKTLGFREYSKKCIHHSC